MNLLHVNRRGAGPTNEVFLIKIDIATGTFLSGPPGATLLLGGKMSDAVTFAELDEQRVELLPARTVMSMITMRPHGHGGDGGNGTGGLGLNILNINALGHQTNTAGTGIGGDGGGHGSHTISHSYPDHNAGGNGGNGQGGIGINALNINLAGNQTNSAANGIGGHGR